jgi:hypothetical protein
LKFLNGLSNTYRNIIKEAWLNFEKNIKSLSMTKSLISYAELTTMAENASIFDKTEVQEAVRFLNDLGNLISFLFYVPKSNGF